MAACELPLQTFLPSSPPVTLGSFECPEQECFPVCQHLHVLLPRGKHPPLTCELGAHLLTPCLSVWLGFWALGDFLLPLNPQHLVTGPLLGF